ncbi:aldose reductase-related protein 2-like [Crassostrea virginica]
MNSSFTAVTLNNGRIMPSVGLGTFQSTKEEVRTAVRTALEAGYRHIDTAYNYKNEDAIGEVLQEFLKSGKVKREELFIVTKLPMIHMEPKLVKHSIDISLKNLQLDYLDLYLIHFPVPFEAMEELMDLKLTRSIGVSNFSISQVERICKVAKYKPVTNQVECHIYWPQKDMFEALEKLGVTITAYAPIGSPGRPQILKGNDDQIVLLEDPVIQRLSQKYGKTPAQVLLRNLLQRGIIVIPKSVTPERIRSNIQVFDFSLTKPEMDEIDGIKFSQQYFYKMGAMFPTHPERPW